MSSPRTMRTCPTTPRTERTITMSVVIGREGIRRRGGRYADRAGVAELVRRARLKIGWPSGRAGSSPAPGIANHRLGEFRVRRPSACELGQRREFELCVAPDERRVAPAGVEQLLVAAALDNPAAVEDDDLLGVADGREPVRDR